MKRISDLTPLERDELRDALADLLTDFVMRTSVEEDFKKLRINDASDAIISSAIISGLKGTL